MSEEDCGICKGGSPDKLIQKMIDYVEKEGSTYLISVGATGTHPDAEGADPPFTYTVGMWKNFGMPEMCVYGLPPVAAAGILNTIREAVRKGTVFELEKRHSEVAEGFHTVFADIKKEDNVFNWARMYYDRRGSQGDQNFPRWQVIWPDEFDVFPWEDGFNERFRNYQPELGEWPTYTAPAEGEEENGKKDPDN